MIRNFLKANSSLLAVVAGCSIGSHLVFEYVGDFVRVSFYRNLYDAVESMTNIRSLQIFLTENVSKFPIQLQCHGPSMEPTLQHNNILITERVSKRIPLFERGDIIIAKSPVEPKSFVCKRIKGLPGDKIHMKPQYNVFGDTKSTITADARADERNKIAIAFGTFNAYDDDDETNDEKIDNQDAASGMLRSRTIIVPRGHVWLEGDNSENSMDSRYYGPVPMGLIQSRVFCRLLPFKEFTVY